MDWGNYFWKKGSQEKHRKRIEKMQRNRIEQRKNPKRLGLGLEMLPRAI